jgi:hypothetical protein
LALHPDKTWLIEFGRYAARDRNQRGEGKPDTFTFSGFTHYSGVVTRQRPSPSGELLRRCAWLQSSKPSRLSFNAASMIAPVRSVYGSASYNERRAPDSAALQFGPAHASPDPFNDQGFFQLTDSGDDDHNCSPERTVCVDSFSLG